MTTKDVLSSVKLKATHQRLVILEAMQKNRTHPTVEQVYDLIKKTNPGISLATVYKSLEVFLQKGLINQVSSTDGLKRYDSNLAAHGHIHCYNTNEIIDFYDEDLNKVIIDFFKTKRINNLKIKNITLNINGDKLDPSKEVIIK